MGKIERQIGYKDMAEDKPDERANKWFRRPAYPNMQFYKSINSSNQKGETDIADCTRADDD